MGVVVTLVHGTFNRRAPWLRPDGALFRALTERGYLVLPFRWSGKNAYWARADAAQELAAQLSRTVTDHPDAQHWVIAHSHGGNIGVHAIHGAARRDYGAKIGLVSLATPFIHMRERLCPPFLILAAGAGALGLSTAMMGLSIEDQSGIGIVRIGSVLGLLFLVQLLLVLRGTRKHGLPRHPAVRKEWVRWGQTPPVGASDLLAIRAAGDEASGLLVAGQFMAWFGTLVGRLVTSMMFTVFGVGTLGVFAIAFFRWEAIFYPVFIGGLVAASIGLALAFGLGLMLIGAAWAFGADGPMASLFSVATAESIPPGSATLVQLELAGDAKLRRLAHSQLYSDEGVIEIILKHISATLPERIDPQN